MSLDLFGLHAFLERYGRGLYTGHTAEVAGCYATPAMVVSRNSASVACDRHELELSFDGLTDRYRQADLHRAVPRITRIEVLDPGLVLAEVVWTGQRDGVPTGHRERYSYLLRRQHDEWRIQVTIALDVPAAAGDQPPDQASDQAADAAAGFAGQTLS